MSDFSSKYNKHTWKNGQLPAVNGSNLNDIETFMEIVDERTRDLDTRQTAITPEVVAGLVLAPAYAAEATEGARTAERAAAEARGYRDETEKIAGFDGSAATVSYDGSASGISANTVQDAIDKSSDLRNVTGGNIWSATASYTVGQRVYYGRGLYRCIVANTGIAPTDSAYWTKITLTTLNSDIVNLQSDSLKHKTVTGTTDANGLISLGVEKSRIYAAFIASNTGTDGKYVITPAVSSNSYVRIVSAVSGANVANYGVTINVLYI